HRSVRLVILVGLAIDQIAQSGLSSLSVIYYSAQLFSRNDPRKPMNSQTANAALKRIGYGGKLVAHGLRSIASTAMNEANLNPDVIEAALNSCAE
ncbi:tyrosine-type recombinase/integrase, partial [Serratia nevei]|uniref:tyrosine-type recombinase/integrase n=1 Tax=Serratia nevei TaxID=2703794 RepID=UPI00254EF4B2